MAAKASLAEAVRCFVFRFLDVRRQFAAATRFQFLYHVRAELGNQTENMPGRENFKTLPIYCMADRHIAGKVQQSFIHILRAQFRPHRAGRKDCKPIFTLSNKGSTVPAPAFLCTSPTYSGSHSSPPTAAGASQNTTASSQGNPFKGSLDRYRSSSWLGRKGVPALIPNYHRGARMAFFAVPSNTSWMH